MLEGVEAVFPIFCSIRCKSHFRFVNKSNKAYYEQQRGFLKTVKSLFHMCSLSIVFLKKQHVVFPITTRRFPYRKPSFSSSEYGELYLEI